VILADTSVWVDHFRDGDPLLAGLLDRGQTLSHPSVIGELALGHLRGRAEILGLLGHLPQATVATAAGIGYVDAQLLAATVLTADPRPTPTLGGRAPGRGLRGQAEMSAA
jgi:predicted nucleic acid-binding protein